MAHMVDAWDGLRATMVRVDQGLGSQKGRKIATTLMEKAQSKVMVSLLPLYTANPFLSYGYSNRSFSEI